MRRLTGLFLVLVTLLVATVVVGLPAVGPRPVPAQASTPATHTAANEALATRVYGKVLSGGDAAVIDELFAPGFVDHQPFPGQPPTRQGLKHAILLFRSAFPDGRFTIDDLFAAGDQVAIRSTFRGTHLGECAGLPATGRAVTFESIDILRIEGDRVAEHWGVSDDLGLLTQLGVIPEPQDAATPTA